MYLATGKSEIDKVKEATYIERISSFNNRKKLKNGRDAFANFLYHRFTTCF